jgi:hypothetical protein
MEGIIKGREIMINHQGKAIIYRGINHYKGKAAIKKCRQSAKRKGNHHNWEVNLLGATKGIIQ